MSNISPTAYDILYGGLSPEDADRIRDEVDAIMRKSLENSKDLLANEVVKAVEKLHCKLTVNPWCEWVEENSGAYQFVEALQDQIWKAMLKGNPAKPSKWTIKELVESWRKNYPDEWQTAINAEMAEQIKRLEESLSFERRCNRNY